MTEKQVMQRLKRDGTAQNRKVYSRHGVQEPMFGVSYANLDKLRKQIKVDHELALKLWASGNHDAKVLATMIADPNRLKSGAAVPGNVSTTRAWRSILGVAMGEAPVSFASSRRAISGLAIAETTSGSQPSGLQGMSVGLRSSTSAMRSLMTTKWSSSLSTPKSRAHSNPVAHFHCSRRPKYRPPEWWPRPAAISA